MSEGNKLVPELRFPEFQDAGEWEKKTLGEVLSYEQPTRYLVENAKYSDEYETPVLTAGKTFLLGYTNETKGIFNNNLPTIIFDDFTTAFQFVDFPFKAKSSAMKMLIPATSETNMKFSFEAMKTVKFFHSTHKRYWISEYQNIEVSFPSPEEQQKIANCLSSIDELITAHTQKHEALKAHKKGLMQQLFPAEGETVPKLRFPEFRDAGEWEEKKFGEICKFIRGPFGGSLKKDMFVKDGYAVYEQSHAIHQNYDSFRYYITKEKFNELKRFSVHPDEIIMSCSGTMGKFSIIPSGSKSGVINQALLKLTVNKELDIRFVKTTMELSSNQEKLLSQSAGGAIKNVVSVSQIKEIDLYIPSLLEQQKIANCLSSIDELITAQAKKIDSLKAHKKGLMQQLFPSEGETVPKLRFPEFRDAGGWEENLLGSCLDYIQPTKYLVTNTAYEDHYKTPVLTAGKTFILGYTDEDHGIFANKLPVIIFDDFTTATKFVDFPFKAKSSAMKILLPKEQTNIKFIYEAMQVIKYEVGAHERHWISKFTKLNVAVPEPEEQQKIADCLSSIDELITAQAKKIETLKAHKKGLMQQLFPSTEALA